MGIHDVWRTLFNPTRAGLTVAAALGLAACGDETTATTTPQDVGVVDEALTTLAAPGLDAAASSSALPLMSAHGISVLGGRWISGRTFEADISTELVSPNAINGPHRIRVTLPNDYTHNPSARYPVLYLLHGGALGANSSQWTTGGGAAEEITTGKPVIVITADGGKVGWFTNWVDQSRGKQQWADFYHQQLIPWVDANLRTVARKRGRAIAGFSMGGYGAVRIAQDRPDLFASVASFSGAVDLEDFGTQASVTTYSLTFGFPASGAFGTTGLAAKNPVKRPTTLAGMQVLLYAGLGVNPLDVTEKIWANQTRSLAAALTKAGVPHFWWMYGRPGKDAPFGCDGGHNFGCWNFALHDALPRMLTVLETPTTRPIPRGTNLVGNGGFELGQGGWDCEGSCGADDGLGFEAFGTGNGWVRNWLGRNELHQTIPVEPNRNYVVTGWIRSSWNNRSGSFGLRTADGNVLGETTFGMLSDYTRLSLTANSGPNQALEVFAGMRAVGDTWLQLDDVSVVGD